MPAWGRSEIESLLPHRGAALFLDGANVDEWHVDAQASWPESHPHLAGHFPGHPLVPGVFLIEAGAQAAGLVLASKPASQQYFGLLSGVRKSLIHYPVRPGERIDFAIDVKRMGASSFFSAVGFAHNDTGRKVLTVEITIAVIERTALEALGD